MNRSPLLLAILAALSVCEDAYDGTACMPLLETETECPLPDHFAEGRLHAEHSDDDGCDGYEVVDVTGNGQRADLASTPGPRCFLLLGDGGVVALWADGAAQRVAYCDSEGQFGVLAQDFPDFLAALAQADTRLFEQLELDAPLDTSQLTAKCEPAPVPASVQQAFSQWVESHSLSAGTTRSPAGEAVRNALLVIARRMLQDGLSKVHKPSAPRWKLTLRLTQQAAWTVEYLDYGVWYPLPDDYGFAELLPALLALMKTPISCYQLSIHYDGHVFGDRGNQLNLEPPDPKS